MQPSISVSRFVDPRPGSREHKAILRAIELQPAVHVIGQFEAAAGLETYFRVRARGRDRHCVIRWFSQLSNEELISCDCPAFTVPVTGPTPCFHAAAALIHEATQDAPELASMGRGKTTYAAND